MVNKYFASFDKKAIHYWLWPVENPKGLVQISHGMAEYMGRYEKIAEYLNGRGFIVFGDDHRCHGGTDPDTKGYSKCEDGDIFNATLRDMNELATIMKKDYPNLPLVLFGHSYGSFLSQRYIELYPDAYDGVILGGSAYMENLATWFGGLVANNRCHSGASKDPAVFIANASFGAYNKKFKKGTFISSIEDECKRYDEDKECGFILSNAFYKSFFDNLPKIYVKMHYDKINKKCPIQLVSGKCDPVGSMGKSVNRLYRFYKQKVKVEDVRLTFYDGVRHEYLNDTSREEASKLIGDFVEEIALKYSK